MNINERIKEMFEHKNPENPLFKTEPGLNEEVVRNISKSKNEPEWMLNFRLSSLQIYKDLPVPKWGVDLSQLDPSKIIYYSIPNAKHNATSWDEVPKEIKETFQRLGIPKAEREYLAGVGSQYDSLVVYHSLKEELAKQGVIFEDMDVAIQKYPELIKEYFMTKCVPVNLHKYVALHGAVWSGGTFIYVPENVKVEMPLQAYFRMNTESFGQFEHTLIILEKNSELHFIEGCSSPKYNSASLHAGCVEIFVKENARLRYSGVENWSNNTYNLNTKRAIVEKNGIIEWVTGNLGSKCSMVYPCSILKGENARADHLSIGYAGKDQIQDIGAKVYHLAPNTTSIIKSKSISKNGGITKYRGLLSVAKNAPNSKSKIQCDALMLDNFSKSNTIPHIDVKENDSDIAHEATVGKISQDQIFYLMSRGLREEQATKMIVNGFIEPIVKELPIEYAVELNRLIELEIENSLG
jgi:Fe-S cluster assembly protein SufB